MPRILNHLSKGSHKMTKTAENTQFARLSVHINNTSIHKRLGWFCVRSRKIFVL